MTGYGQSEYRDQNCKITVEIRSVNHRYGDISIHLPRAFYAQEDAIKKIVATKLARGKVDVFISFEAYNTQTKKIKVDKDLAIAYYEVLLDISKTVSISPPNSVYDIAAYPDVLQLAEDTNVNDECRDQVLVTTEQAVTQLVKMRAKEGEHLADDLLMRINILENYVDAIEKRAPQIITEYQHRLTARITELLAAADLDTSRLLQEVLLFSEKVNCTEELVRLQSHFKQFKTAIMTAEKPIGRKLDFIIQEMNREANTIASKANDAETTKLIVDVKSEIEKIREQVQNIE